MSEEKEIHCSFCGASGHDRNVFRSQEDPNIYICEECIEQTHEILVQYRADNEIDTHKENVDVMTPIDIKNFLDQYVIGQDHAKQILSVAVYNHMKMLEHWDNFQEGNIEIEKSNIIMCGPSGSGKTHIIKNLARLFNVPYAIADATTLTESGLIIFFNLNLYIRHG